MACGLPVITTRHSGLSEQVADGATGIVVPEGDWHALAGAIMHLMDHPELWGAMGRAGRARVERQYGNERLLDEQVEVYQRLIREHLERR